MRNQLKLIILQTHPIHTWAPLCRALAAQPSLSVKVIYLTDSGAKPYFDQGFGQTVEWDTPVLDGYEYYILKEGSDILTLSFWARHDKQLVRILDAERPDWILLDGYSSLMDWVALHWAIRNRSKIAYKSDSSIHVRRGGKRVILRQLHVRYFFHYVSAFFSPSQSNHEYLLRYGAEASRIHRYPYPVEFGRFNCGNISGREYDFVWVGKLSARKRPLDYLNALKILKQRGHANFRASLIGDGELMDSVLREGHNLIQSGNLVVHGFVNQNRMPLELGKCKIFVFTSEREPYGLVASEAAAAGAALVVADRIGCVGPDSVAQPGVNTLTYPVGDITVLADVIERLFADQILLESMQKASLIIATEHDASKAAYVITNTLVNS